MNVMFMPPYSSVIEIFPYHFDHNLYPAASISSGLGYYPVHSYNGSDMWSRFAVCQALHLSVLSSPKRTVEVFSCLFERDLPIEDAVHEMIPALL